MDKQKIQDIRIVHWAPGKKSRIVDAFLNRPAFDEKAESTAASVLSDIRKQGDVAVAKYAMKFDGCALSPSDFKVSRKEIAAASRKIDAEFRKAAAEAEKRISKFSRAGLRKDWQIKTPKGGSVGERFTPLDRVGVYVPGGEAPLVSTALMTAVLAREAGVPDIIACTPADKDGAVNPYILYAMKLAGVSEIYKVGGIQAIGAMAYGTDKIPAVQKIVGPGGPYVTAAKRLVYGIVDLDLVAGPSEIAVIADESAKPDQAAMDLLSQAEHGTGHEKILFITTSSSLAKDVRVELVSQAAMLPRSEAIRRVLNHGTLLVVVPHLDGAAELSNRFAPEHLELMVKGPRRLLRNIKNAGAVFLGGWTPESAGDFVAGPSHVLPTGGTAAMFSGLTVDSFRKRTSLVEFTKADLKAALPVIEAFGRVEDLEAHAKSARIRF